MTKLGLPLMLLCWVCTTSTVSGSGDAITDAMMATYKIMNKDSTATCFVISRPAVSGNGHVELFLITAAHALEKMSGDECRIAARTKREDGTFDRLEIPLKIRSANEKLWVRHPRVDVAALRLELPESHSIAALEFQQLFKDSDFETLGFNTADEVWIPGFPAQLESNKAGFPVLRRGSVASFPLRPIKSNETFIVSSNTFGGDSGAPVVVRRRKPNDPGGRLSIVGLVIGQHRQTTTTISPFEERSFHRPLGLAIAVHSEFIRQTVDLVKPSDAGR